MQYFDKDFRKFTIQFIFIIFISLIIIGVLSDYLNKGGGEARVLGI